MTDEQNTLENELPVDTEQQDETEVIDQTEGETTEAEEGEKVVEPWMETEEDQTNEPEKEEAVSLKAFLKNKKKFKKRSIIWSKAVPRLRLRIACRPCIKRIAWSSWIAAKWWKSVVTMN